MGERLFIGLQHVLPQHLVSRLVHWLARVEARWFSRRFIRVFARAFKVDMSDAEQPSLDSYPTFNAFFTRSLRPDARPLDDAPDAVLCPVDGTISQAGPIENGMLLQAKGSQFSLQSLLGNDAELAQQLDGGTFATIYLAPYNYHRIHMPLAGTTQSMRLVPGRLFSVNAVTARRVPGLFARNERVVCNFTTPAGPMAMVLVGAINVGSIETVWAGEVTPGGGRDVRTWAYGLSDDNATTLDAGAEMGRFNMGSTVIVAFPPGAVVLEHSMTPGTTVRMGERLGHCV
ncbi:MAG: archaetidylserine decarboxylase [Pseudomonadota bacterium]